METSHYIAEALSLYFLVAGIAMAANNRRYVTIFSEMSQSPALIILSGVFALVIGILMILSHNIWESNWRTLVTIAGWLAFLKGTALLIMPERFLSYFTPFYTSENIRYMGYVVVLLGLVFGFFGLAGD
ncbi:MAG: hypothetical protein JSR37_08650 [Verrucomicrobia bacterium]|nr:hypothetical protein [Verrucomicrobiota bacterium]MBS0637967.1 hypothetical protein [Verrucomicrobiota bacterium]